MSRNLYFVLLKIILLLLFFSCMIAGDAFLSKIAFNSTAMNCDSFSNTVEPMQNLVRNNTCIDLDNTQLGFARFRIVIFWITFVLLTGVIAYILWTKYTTILKSRYLLLALIGGFTFWLLILIGGAFLTQFAFNAVAKNCNNSSKYCYDLENEHKINIARITSVFCFIFTIATTALLGYASFEYI
jgi:hypothetical protein